MQIEETQCFTVLYMLLRNSNIDGVNIHYLVDGISADINMDGQIYNLIIKPKNIQPEFDPDNPDHERV